MTDRPADALPDDPFDRLVLDEDFVRAGRREGSAEERLARAARVARENARGPAGWRTPAPAARPATGPQRGRPRREPGSRRRAAVAGMVAVAVLAGYGYLNLPGRAPAPTATRAAASPVVPGRRVLPLPPDVGGSGGYRFMSLQGDAGSVPVAWDPCRPIRYVVRRGAEPPGGPAVVAAAVAEVSAATGLQFVREPDTDEPLVDQRRAVQRDRYGQGFAPVLVAWSDERQSQDLAGDVSGVAGGQIAGPDGARRYVSGTVLLDADDARTVLSRPDGVAQLTSTVLHELGHLVGLDHVSDRSQLMFSEAGDNRLDLGLGDRRGLRLLGSGPCYGDTDRLAAGES